MLESVTKADDGGGTGEVMGMNVNVVEKSLVTGLKKPCNRP